MIGLPYLRGRDRYERSMHGWVDNTHADAFTHTVALADDDLSIELTAVCTPSPDYEVRAAGARVVAGRADPGIAVDLGALAGARMVGGFTRRLVEVCGDRVGAGHFVDAAIEVARLARQIAKLPREATAGVEAGDPERCWRLDTTGWVDLPDSCFTYSEAGRALLGTRPVSTPMSPDLYSPPPGARKVFVRRKLSRLVLTGRRLHLFSAMHDNVHGFDLHYEIDLAGGVVSAAHSVVSRLPYAGICSEPQGRINLVVGQRVDAGLRKRLQALIGGGEGCGQLYDLTADLLKLLDLPDPQG